jgi:hypothetical protein
MGLPIVLLIPLFLWIPIEWRHDPLMGRLGTRYHIALFFVLALLLHNRGPMKGRFTVVAAVCLALGAVTEHVQTYFGRTAAFHDWLMDAQGIGFAACWIWYRRTGRRSLPLTCSVLLMGLVLWPLRDLPITVPEVRAARARFPLLEDFERPHALALWSRQSNIARSLVDVPGRGKVLQIDNDGAERWPGATSRRMPWDWSGYAELHVDCRLVEPSPDSMLVKIQLEDRASRGDVDIAMMSFTIRHQWQTLMIPLKDLVTHNKGRPLSGQEILAVSVLAIRRQPGPISLQVDRLRLVGE